MQNSTQIRLPLAETFRHCPLEKPGTASAAKYTAALALEYIVNATYGEKRVHVTKKQRKGEQESRELHFHFSQKRVLAVVS